MNFLIVDDDKSVRFALNKLLKKEEDNIYEASNGEEALKILKEQSIEAAIIDYQMEGINGLELLKIIKKDFAWIQVIIITAFGSEKIAIKAIKLGAYDYVKKPFDNSELTNRVNHIRESLFNKNKDISNEHGYYFSPVMISIIEKIKTVSKADIPILITGESGTGKELIAKNCHDFSQKTGKFIAINCSTLPETLIENELFGSEKGSYTGSIKNKIGFFEMANEGTLFLDEIGEMNFDLQAKLLRVIQENEIIRVGGNVPIKINTRTIAATNKNIENEVKGKKFREDLFYRLNVCTIKVPPLRDRTEDIKPLSFVFLNEFNKKYNKNIIGFSKQVEEFFLSYNWPGNIRELRNKIEQAVILCNKEWIDINHFDLDVINKKQMKNKNEDKKNIEKEIQNPFSQFSKNIVKAKKEFEKKFILFYLNKNNWNITKTAEEIGIYRQDLYKKIKKLNIERKY